MGKEIKVEEKCRVLLMRAEERETAMLESSGEDRILTGNTPVHHHRTWVQQRDELSSQLRVRDKLF